MEINTRPKSIGRGRGRPAQALYMPPAQRNRGSEPKIMEDKKSPLIQFEDLTICNEPELQEMPEDLKKCNNVPSTPQMIESDIESANPTIEAESDIKAVNYCVHKPAIIDTPQVLLQVENEPLQTPADDKAKSDREKDKEVTRTKTKHIKMMDVKCDVLQISVAKNIKKSPIKLVQVDQWEDLINDEDVETTSEDIKHNESSKNMANYEDYDSDETENINDAQLEHILEIFDFPSTFKTPDIMQIYSELDQNSIYVKWLSDTRALLVLGSAIQAKRALNIENPLIKSRPAALGSPQALDMIRTSNLRPAMKRPQTSMHAARRMITTALGAKSSVSREVQQREREALRKAKEERRAQRQNERDAWEGNPRPTTA